MKKRKLAALTIGAFVAAILLFWATPILQGWLLSRLCEAAFRGEINTVKICLMARPDLNKNPTWDGLTGFRALKCAAMGGNVDVINLLLQNGANPNPPGPNPLIAACSRGHYAAVKMLLEHGADPNANGNAFGDGTPLSAAMGHPKIIELLQVYGAKE